MSIQNTTKTRKQAIHQKFNVVIYEEILPIVVNYYNDTYGIESKLSDIINHFDLDVPLRPNYSVGQTSVFPSISQSPRVGPTVPVGPVNYGNQPVPGPDRSGYNSLNSSSASIGVSIPTAEPVKTRVRINRKDALDGRMCDFEIKKKSGDREKCNGPSVLKVGEYYYCNGCSGKNKVKQLIIAENKQPGSSKLLIEKEKEKEKKIEGSAKNEQTVQNDKREIKRGGKNPNTKKCDIEEPELYKIMAEPLPKDDPLVIKYGPIIKCVNKNFLYSPIGSDGTLTAICKRVKDKDIPLSNEEKVFLDNNGISNLPLSSLKEIKHKSPKEQKVEKAKEKEVDVKKEVKAEKAKEVKVEVKVDKIVSKNKYNKKDDSDDESESDKSENKSEDSDNSDQSEKLKKTSKNKIIEKTRKDMIKSGTGSDSDSDRSSNSGSGSGSKGKMNPQYPGLALTKIGSTKLEALKKINM